jgi:hypothetical protein
MIHFVTADAQVGLTHADAAAGSLLLVDVGRGPSPADLEKLHEAAAAGQCRRAEVQHPRIGLVGDVIQTFDMFTSSACAARFSRLAMAVVASRSNAIFQYIS